MRVKSDGPCRCGGWGKILSIHNVVVNPVPPRDGYLGVLWSPQAVQDTFHSDCNLHDVDLVTIFCVGGLTVTGYMLDEGQTDALQWPAGTVSLRYYKHLIHKIVHSKWNSPVYTQTWTAVIHEWTWFSSNDLFEITQSQLVDFPMRHWVCPHVFGMKVPIHTMTTLDKFEKSVACFCCRHKTHASIDTISQNLRIVPFHTSEVKQYCMYKHITNWGLTMIKEHLHIMNLSISLKPNARMGNRAVDVYNYIEEAEMIPTAEQAIRLMAKYAQERLASGKVLNIPGLGVFQFNKDTSTIVYDPSKFLRNHVVRNFDFQ